MFGVTADEIIDSLAIMVEGVNRTFHSALEDLARKVSHTFVGTVFFTKPTMYAFFVCVCLGGDKYLIAVGSLGRRPIGGKRSRSKSHRTDRTTT